MPVDLVLARPTAQAVQITSKLLAEGVAAQFAAKAGQDFDPSQASRDFIALTTWAQLLRLELTWTHAHLQLGLEGGVYAHAGERVPIGHWIIRHDGSAAIEGYLQPHSPEEMKGWDKRGARAAPSHMY